MVGRLSSSWVVLNPEMDAVYELRYMRAWHPSYAKDGGVPAIDEVKFRLVSNRCRAWGTGTAEGSH